MSAVVIIIKLLFLACTYILIQFNIYTMGHKKRASLFRTITPAFLDEFQHFVHQ